jgi:hypothetical protein
MIKLTEREMTGALLGKWFSLKKRKTIKVECIKGFTMPDEDTPDFTKGKTYVMHKRDSESLEAYVTNDQKQNHWIYDLGNDDDFFHTYFKIINE